MESGVTHNSDELASLRTRRLLRHLPRPSRKSRARRRSPFNRLHQHHRVLCSRGFSLRARTSVLTSIRKQKLGPPLTLASANGGDFSDGKHTHKRFMAETGNNHGVDGTGQRNHSNGGNLLFLFFTRPFNKHPFAAIEGVFEVAESGEADDVLFFDCGGVSCAVELLAGGGDGVGGGRSSDGVGDDEFEYGGVDGRVCVGVEEEDGSGGDGGGISVVRVVAVVVRGGGTDESGGAELFGDMFGVVVV